MPTKDQEARKLAQAHYDVEEGMVEIYRIKAPPNIEANRAEPIKLLEVNEHTVPAGILPVHFGPSPDAGYHYASIIVEVTPEEYERIRAKQLPLPRGWKIGPKITR